MKIGRMDVRVVGRQAVVTLNGHQQGRFTKADVGKVIGLIANPAPVQNITELRNTRTQLQLQITNLSNQINVLARGVEYPAVNGFDLTIRRDGASVGCTRVTLPQLLQIYGRL